MTRPRKSATENNPSPLSRRQFLRQAATVTAGVGAAGAMGFPTIVPSSALGKDGAVAPSQRTVMASIGTGGRGSGLLETFLENPSAQYVAVCDVDEAHRAQALQKVNRKYNNTGCRAFKDFREVLQMKDVDAVVVATPDHWHALASVAALNAGKHVYCEKPLANSVYESKAIRDAWKKTGKVLQTGSHERSNSQCRFACELVRSGHIGKLQSVEINLPDDDGHLKDARTYTRVPPAEPIPAGLDYDLWLGHTPPAPYHPRRCHFWWRFILSYGGGVMTEAGAHVIDIAQLGLDKDDSGPVEFVAKGRQTPGSLYTSLWDYEFTNTYDNGVKLVGSTKKPRGLKFVGDNGWLFVAIHGGKLEASNNEILKAKMTEMKVQLGRTYDHQKNFLEAVRDNKPLTCAAHAEIGHRTASLCHLNNLAMLTGKKIVWDPKAERITNEPALNAMLRPKMREPWAKMI